MSKKQLQTNNERLSAAVEYLKSNIKVYPDKKPFSQMTWEDISIICKAGKASEYWAIGDTKNMVEGDTTTALRIIGFDHDYVSDMAAYGREKAGITLEAFKGQSSLYVQYGSSHDSTTSWHNSKIRTTTLAQYLNNTIPTTLKNVIVPVGKEFVYRNTGSLGSVSDTVFLLSAREIFGSAISGYGSGGEQYAYYAAGNSTTKYSGTNLMSWWTRSPLDSAAFQFINTSGSAQGSYMDSYHFVTPCFCV